jgi:RNA polymerase sigma factor (sigma-70 family)
MAQPLPETLAQIIGEMTAAMRGDAALGPALLAQYTETHDGEAFRGLLRLYAPLVWGVCQRCLRNPGDAEDAFQATFIVLARKAGRIARPERLSAWLHGVALRASRKVREQTARRREVLTTNLPDSGSEDAFPDPDLRGVLDEELDRLPDDLRQAFVLCRVEGRTYAEAARLLGCALPTVGQRVGKATELLKARLDRRGLNPSGAASLLVPVVPSSILLHALNSPSATATAVADAVIRSMAGYSLWWIIGFVSLVVVGIGAAMATGPVLTRPAPVAAINRPERPEMRHDAPIRLLQPLKDGKVVAVDEKGNVRVWKVATGRELRRLDRAAPSGKFDCIFAAPTLAVLDLGKPQRLLLWDAETGTTTPELEPMRKLLGEVPHPRLGVLDGKVVLSSTHDKDLFVWDAATAEVHRRVTFGNPLRSVILTSSSRAILQVVPDPLTQREQELMRSGKKVLVNSQHIPQFINPFAGQMIAELNFGLAPSERREGELLVAAVSANGQALAVRWADDGKGETFYTRVLDARTGKVKQRIAHGGSLIGATFSPDAMVLALLLRSDRPAKPTSGGPAARPRRQDGGETVTEQWVELWDLTADGKRKVLKVDATALSFAANSKTFVTGGRDGRIRHWETETLKAVTPSRLEPVESH